MKLSQWHSVMNEDSSDIGFLPSPLRASNVPFLANMYAQIYFTQSAHAFGIASNGDVGCSERSEVLFTFN
jgi:hypothetical protein